MVMMIMMVLLFLWWKKLIVGEKQMHLCGNKAANCRASRRPWHVWHSHWDFRFDVVSEMIWVFPKIGVPQNGWFIMENPKTLLKWMIWGYHYFRKHPYLLKQIQNIGKNSSNSHQQYYYIFSLGIPIYKSSCATITGKGDNRKDDGVSFGASVGCATATSECNIHQVPSCLHLVFFFNEGSSLSKYQTTSATFLNIHNENKKKQHEQTLNNVGEKTTCCNTWGGGFKVCKQQSIMAIKAF